MALEPYHPPNSSITNLGKRYILSAQKVLDPFFKEYAKDNFAGSSITGDPRLWWLTQTALQNADLSLTGKKG